MSGTIPFFDYPPEIRKVIYAPKEVPLGDNRIRKQARLGHLSPAALSQQYYADRRETRWTP
jgi:hypothetical protein